MDNSLFWYLILRWGHRRTETVSFRGGGGWSQLPEYFIHCLPENEVVLPEYYMYMIFCPKMAIWNILGGGGGAQPPAPTSYVYGWGMKIWK